MSTTFTPPRGSAAADPSADGELPRGATGEKRIQAMFGRIAGIYDRLNTVMTAGMHHKWRRRAVDLAEVQPGARVLDVATGTGDLALEVARRIGADGEVVGVDYVPEMLTIARVKAASEAHEHQLAQLHFEQANALLLPYPTDSFDAATVGFGARNFTDLKQGLREMIRVVKPGGHVVVLEIVKPQKLSLALFFSLWLDRIVPLLGVLSGDSDAYHYLPLSVRRFPVPPVLAAKLAQLGLTDIHYIVTGGGTIAIHSGTVKAS
jgi:demethylmenaquinone methyltransferase/2-methoxy-6-polyprenyl-1,4-benzoquinol methylase